MTEERLTEEMDKALHEIFDTKQIVDFQFDLVQKAFLKGLEFGMKVNKEQAKAKLNVTTISDCPIKYEWHDLRKNPRDLPTEDCKDYLAIALDDTEPSLYMYLASDEGQWEWEPRRIAVLSNDQIKAWCEIPTFEEDA